jgi:hypothetical protein
MAMGIVARVREFSVVAGLAVSVLAPAPRALAGDALVLHQRLPALQSLVAHAPARIPAITATAEPICDIFANGYDPTGATPCAGCFDATIDFNETDVDCGGADCKACAVGQQCVIGSDCQSGTCTNSMCTGALSLVISQVQTRGNAGAADEFVEIYNPGSTSVVFDSGWTLSSRSTAAGTYTGRLVGANQVIPAHGHILYAGTGYDAPVVADGTLAAGITDAGSLVLAHNLVTVDALCFYYDAATLATLSTVGYTCEGTPVSNLPHNNSATGDIDASLERKPGGAGGNMQDTGDNSADFAANASPDPHNLTSTAVP